MSPRVNVVNIENARIAFRNFEGKEGRFNPKGRRNFCVLLDDELAEELGADGWNVRWLEPKKEDDSRQAYIQVSVSFVNFPPKIMLITDQGRRLLEESDVSILDWADIENVDLIIRPYHWEVNEKTGVKAYLKAMYVTLLVDKFEAKYKDVPDSAANNLEEDGL